MGQKVGKAHYTDVYDPFVNVSRDAVEDVWEAFNDIAEGFGIDVDELKEMFVVLQEPLDMAKKPLAQLTERVFQLFDTDKNDLTDALELVGTLVMSSGMTLIDKLEFLFNMYDFDESGELTIDEITLMMKSTLTGLAKVSNDLPPPEPEIEIVAQDALKRSGKSVDERLTRAEFVTYCRLHPDVRSWVYFYDDVDDAMDLTAEQPEEFTPSIAVECDIQDRSPAQVAALDPDLFARSGLFEFMGGAEGDPDEPVFDPPSWRQTATNLAPSREPDFPNTPPDITCSLETVHGFRCEDVRNNVTYNHRGEIVYQAGTVGIVYTRETGKQRFHLSHADEILSIAVHVKSGKTIVATGEIGPVPRIVVWDTDSMNQQFIIRGLHKRGVIHLAFSPDGTRLASVGADPHHTVAVYALDDPQGPRLVYSGKSHKNKVFALAYTSQERFVTAGVRHLYFWDPSPVDGSVERKKGIFGKINVRSCLCVTSHPTEPTSTVSGTTGGQIIVWKWRNAVRCINGHQGAVNVLRTVPNVGILSGGVDGKIRIWFRDITPGLMFDVNSLGSLNPSVRSLAWDSHNNRILISTLGCEIWEISDADGSDLNGGPLVQGHYRGELWGLSVHPSKAEYCTVGDDQTLRVWDSNTRKCLRMTRLASPCRAVAYSPNGRYIAIGMGRPEIKRYIHRIAMDALSKPPNSYEAEIARKEGAYALLDEADLNIVHESRDSKSWIQQIKFSPDGSTLAVASSDKDIYLYNTDDLAAKGKCRGHNRGVTDVDFSTDSNWLQTSSASEVIDLTSSWYAAKTRPTDTKGFAPAPRAELGKLLERPKGVRPEDFHIGYEIMYWSAETGEPLRNSNVIRDMEWDSVTMPIGYHVQGAWPAINDAAAASSTALSKVVKCPATRRSTAQDAMLYSTRYNQVTAVCRSTAGTEAVIGDYYGRLRIFRYPVYRQNIPYIELRGHSPLISRCAFTKNDAFLLTLGGRDRCIFQWRVTRSRSEAIAEEKGEEQKPVEEWDEELDAELFKAEPNPALEALALNDMEAVFDFEDIAQAAGDKFMAVKPWVSSVVTPSRPPPQSIAPPGEQLKLEWVFGAQFQRARNNLLYTHSGDIVYYSSTLGTVLAKERDTRGVQRFMTNHTDEIQCLSMHPEGVLAATGQRGKQAKILVWDTTTMRVQVELTGHTQGVSQVAFGASTGQLVASVGMDANHTLLIHDWSNSSLIATALGKPNAPYAISWAPDESAVVVAGHKFITFYQISGRLVNVVPAILGDRGVWQKMLCIGWAGRDCLVGTLSGELYRFNKTTLSVVVPAHTGAVTAMYCNQHGVVTGGLDGIIKMWSTTLELQREFNMAKLNTSLNPGIRSVYWVTTANRLLVGTAGSEIYELSSATGQDLNKSPLVAGHFSGELWGLAMHPTRAEFATVGDDSTVRVWDIALKTQKAYCKLDSGARSVAYSPDGLRLAVGLGGRPLSKTNRQRKDGGFVVLDGRDLSKVHEGRDCKEWITDIKYAPDGNTLGLASADGRVYLYDIGNAYEVRGIFDKHNSFVTHIDFSADSQFMQSNCGAYELLFSDAANAAYIPGASSLKDVEWETFTCTLGWPVQGVWPRFADGTVINACDRSRSRKLLVHGDSTGKVSLTRYPCIKPDAGTRVYRAHCAPVNKVRWAANDTHVVSVGGADRCIMLWKLMRDEAEVAKEAGESGVDSDLDLLDMKDEDAGLMLEFAAVKPWVSVIVAPSNAPKGSTIPPDENLELDWVHGFRSQDVRSNLSFNMKGAVVYNAATMGIIFNKQDHRQDFYRGHRQNVLSIAMDPTGQYVATGEQGRRPKIHIWNAVTGTPVVELPAFHRRAIGYLAFSPLPVEVSPAQGMPNVLRHAVRRLVSIGMDDDHTIAVWRSLSGAWQDTLLEAYEASEKLKPLFLRFQVSLSNGPFDFVTGGVKHIRFWAVDGRNVKATNGLFGAQASLQPLVSAAEIGGQLVTGTVSGHLYVWKDRTVVRKIKAHSGTIYTMDAVPSFMVSGSKDGLVKVWDSDVVNIMTFNIAEATPSPFNPIVHSVAISHDRGNTTILVGTKGSEIYEISRDSSRTIRLATGHCADEVWGLAPHPTNPDAFVTTGDDHTVRVWSVSARAQTGFTQAETMVRCADWSANGEMLGVGVGGRVGKGRHRKDGAFLILSGSDLSVMHEGQDSRDWISDLKFSSDGSLMAVGSQDSKIYIYDILRDAAFGARLRAKGERHNANITHLDFDSKGSYIRSNCGANELLFFRTVDGEVVLHPSDLKDTVWATQTSVFGWHLQGIWPRNEESIEIGAAHVNREENLVVTGDSLGRLKLFRYPSPVRAAPFTVATGHAARITNVRFTADSQYVLSLGGADRCIMQWKVKAPPGAPSAAKAAGAPVTSIHDGAAGRK